MRVNINGAWVTVPDGSMPLLAQWDDSLSANPAASDACNRGCPPGYFCEYVSADDWWWPFNIVGESAAYHRQCRRADEQIMTDGGITLAQETGEGVWEENVESIASALRQPVEAIAAVVPQVSAFGGGMTTGLVIAGLALLYFSGRR